MKEIIQKKTKILHIEDDREFAEATAFLLGEDYQVNILESTTSVFEEIERNTPDVILLDLDLPGGLAQMRTEEGLALLRILNNSKVNEIPVIVLTSQSDSDVYLECFSLGATAFYEKPAKIGEIMKTIQMCLKHRSSI
ncbi:MAG: response regulator [candidate division Zixibacteria bacterium]|nr:response regulator [candidate division Zixibacteria bacterium]